MTLKETDCPAFTVALAGCWVMTGGFPITVMVRVADPVTPELMALRVTAKVPAAVGVPVIFPVAVLRESPAGKLAAAKLVGQLVAEI